MMYGKKKPMAKKPNTKKKTDAPGTKYPRMTKPTKRKK